MQLEMMLKKIECSGDGFGNEMIFGSEDCCTGD